MNPTTTRLPHGNRLREDISVFHFKRFLEAFSAPMAAPVADACANEVQVRAKFRVLHVKRTLAAPSVLSLTVRSPEPTQGG